MYAKSAWPRWFLAVPLLVALSVAYVACGGGVEGADVIRRDSAGDTMTQDSVSTPDSSPDVNATDAPQTGG